MPTYFFSYQHVKLVGVVIIQLFPMSTLCIKMISLERKNTCSVDNDKLLADIVLTYMKNGGTQASAF